MAFVEKEPLRVKPTDYAGDKVKISFPILHKKTSNTRFVMIYIGKDIGKRVGFEHGTKIQLFIDDENPLLWLLKKADKTATKWTTLIDTKHNTSSPNKLFKFQRTWKDEVPPKCEAGVLYTSFDFYDGGIRLALPGCSIKDLTI